MIVNESGEIMDRKPYNRFKKLLHATITLVVLVCAKLIT